MKRFQCGDVVPGCKAMFCFPSEEEVLAAVAVHAREDHHLHAIPVELVQQVRSQIREIAA